MITDKQELDKRRLAFLAFTCRVAEKVILRWQRASGLSFDDFWALANAIGWRGEQDLKGLPPGTKPPRKHPVHRLKKAARS